jgi:hypothetical protein
MDVTSWRASAPSARSGEDHPVVAAKGLRV